MKRKGKAFDCVDMKNAIQARLLARRRRMGVAEMVADIERGLAESAEPAARFWRRLAAGEERPGTARRLVNR